MGYYQNHILPLMEDNNPDEWMHDLMEQVVREHTEQVCTKCRGEGVVTYVNRATCIGGHIHDEREYEAECDNCLGEGVVEQ